MPDPSRAEASTNTLNQASQSEALKRLQRGDISLDQYLEECVERAVSHLVGLAGPERLEFVRQILRDQLRSDPTLVQYVREATGDTTYAT